MPKKLFASKNLHSSFVSVIVILLIAVLIFLFILFLSTKSTSSSKDWSVVYLSTGEIYIGKLSSFPNLKLTNAYLLQVITTPAEGEGGEDQTTFQLTPLKDALWAPKKLYLNREQVVFYGPIEETSRVVEAIRRGVSQ